MSPSCPLCVLVIAGGCRRFYPPPPGTTPALCLFVVMDDQMRVVGIFVSAESRDDSWAVAIDPSGSVLDHLQMPFQRDMRAKKLKVRKR